MRIGLLISGTIFLLNPNINIVDFLPDFIGYLLIYRGLFMFSDIDCHMEDAYKKAKWLIIVNLAKLIFILMLPSSNDTDVLLFTFMFAVAEIILTVPFFSEFFAGMNYLCSKYDNTTALKAESETKFFVYLFVTSKTFLPLVPELFSLSDSVYGLELKHDHYKHLYNIEAVKRLCILGVFAIVLILGIITGIKLIGYLASLKNNKSFISCLRDYYNTNILSDTKLWSGRYFNLVVTLFSFGIMFFNNFSLDSIAVIPDTIGYILIIIGAVYLSKLGQNGFWLIFTSIIGAMVCTSRDFLRILSSGFGAYSQYYLQYYKSLPATVLNIVCTAVFVVSAVIMLLKIRNIANLYQKEVVFPFKALVVITPLAGFSTLIKDLLPALENTALAQKFPDYYAIGTFIVSVCLVAITLISASGILKIKINVK